jgi:hypothetical protein
MPKVSAHEGRDLGKNMADQGVFEIDTSSGSVEWANDFALGVIGCSLEQLSSMSVFDLTPERFHESIRGDFAEEDTGRWRRFYILPTRTADGKVAWWYVFRTGAKESRRWAYAEHIQDTPQSGPEYSFMVMQVDLVNNQAFMEARVDDLEKWIRDEIDRVGGELGELRAQFSNILRSLERAEEAALDSARESIASKNASLATQQELKKYVTKEEMQRHFEKFDSFEEQSTRASAEILRLIRTDTVQEERLRTYEEHVKRTTESAVKAIEAQASKSGKSLSRKVTVPVFAITTLAMVIQALLRHWNVHIVP